MYDRYYRKAGSTLSDKEASSIILDDESARLIADRLNYIFDMGVTADDVKDKYFHIKYDSFTRQEPYDKIFRFIHYNPRSENRMFTILEKDSNLVNLMLH